MKHVGTQHIIELNGRRYDALTGKMMPHTEVSAAKAPPSHGPKQSIDGFVRKKPHAPRKVAETHVAHHEAERSHTLMRKAVAKPVVATALHGRRSNTPALPTTATKPHIQHASSYSQPPERLSRAEQIRRSKLIQRFGSDITATAPSKAHKQAAQHASQVAIESVSLPLSDTSRSDQQQSAIEAAVSHKQPKIKKTPLHHRMARKVRIKPRTFSISAAVMAFVVLGGFFGYQNAPNLSMLVASRNANVDGSLPGYKPAGFGLNGPIKYQPGEIIVSYKSNSDGRNFQITQRASAWDTESLRENFVAGLKTPYQTVQEKGKTIYLYEESSATWVDGGVWYKIDGQSQLNTEQVLDLASSL